MSQSNEQDSVVDRMQEVEFKQWHIYWFKIVVVRRAAHDARISEYATLFFQRAVGLIPVQLLFFCFCSLFENVLTRNVCLTITHIHYIFIVNWMDLSFLLLCHKLARAYAPYIFMWIKRYIVPLIVCINIFMVRKRCSKHNTQHMYICQD